MPIIRAGRRRWAIENETFNILKARDVYNFEHNYGHGSNHLADVFPTFATLALLIGQVRQFCCARLSEAKPLSLGQDAPSVPGVPNPGLADLLSRHVEENAQARTRRYVPYWTITDQDTLERHPALHRSFRNQAAA